MPSDSLIVSSDLLVNLMYYGTILAVFFGYFFYRIVMSALNFMYTTQRIEQYSNVITKHDHLIRSVGGSTTRLIDDVSKDAHNAVSQVGKYNFFTQLAKQLGPVCNNFVIESIPSLFNMVKHNVMSNNIVGIVNRFFDWNSTKNAVPLCPYTCPSYRCPYEPCQPICREIEPMPKYVPECKPAFKPALEPVCQPVCQPTCKRYVDPIDVITPDFVCKRSSKKCKFDDLSSSIDSVISPNVTPSPSPYFKPKPRTQRINKLKPLRPVPIESPILVSPKSPVEPTKTKSPVESDPLGDLFKSFTVPDTNSTTISSNPLLNTGMNMFSSFLMNALSKPETIPKFDSKTISDAKNEVKEIFQKTGIQPEGTMHKIIDSITDKVAQMDLSKGDIVKNMFDIAQNVANEIKNENDTAPKTPPSPKSITLPKLNIEDLLKNLQMEFKNDAPKLSISEETTKYVDGVSPEDHGIRVYDTQTKKPFDFSRVDPDADTILIPKERVEIITPKPNKETVIVDI